MNVGKSTLFNRLVAGSKSMTYDFPGVTRDFVSDITNWQDVTFELIDSGGVSFAKQIDQITQQVRDSVYQLLAQADLIIQVCDGTAGVLPADRELLQQLRKLNKPILLVVNKSDVQSTKEQYYEFLQFGVAETFLLSAQHGHAIGDLLDAIATHLKDFKAPVAIAEPQYRVVLLGKPNVGKSSLMNLLAQQERAIVSAEAGTTREALDARINLYQETIQLTDTPGVRRPSAVTEDLEQLMVKSSLRAVKHADIVLLMIDAADQALSDQELKLAFYAFEQHKALIVLFNKQDLVTEIAQEELSRRLEEYHYFFKKIEKLMISCATKQNIGKVLPLVHTVWQRHNQVLPALELKTLCLDALERKPLYHKTNRLTVKEFKQVQAAPITLALYVNVPAWFGHSQLAFFENILRRKYALKSVPLRFVVRKQGKQD